MNNPTDEQIGAAMGRLWKEYRGIHPKGHMDDYVIALTEFLNSLIPVEKVWNPRELKDGEKYWYVLEGTACYTNWYSDNIDKWNLATGNIFLSKESAELYRAEKLKQLD